MTTVFIVLFGILLPAITLAVELSTAMCAETFFDPIPTFGHALLVALVPLANLLALVGWFRDWRAWRTALLWLNAIAIGIAFVYSLLFLPLLPLSVFAIIAYGMGLLPLAPLFSLLCALMLRARLADLALPDAPADASCLKSPSSFVAVLLGAGVGIALLLALEARTAITMYGAEMAASASHDRAASGVRLLRWCGSRDELLRMCYAGRGGDFFMGGGVSPICNYLTHDISRDAAQKVFFRVAGVPYNSLPPPRGVSRSPWADFDFDPDVGGTVVAGRRKGLSLSASRLDALCHADAAVTYMEWTMVFQNDHMQQREARAQIILPPGGVVSRVTLWVNGEPREAAFAGSAQVREAYNKVVSQRRDPLLVTWAGNDRVLIQCFPVPPNGEMKIRLGITAPMTPLGIDAAAVKFPCFAERNFNISADAIHSVWCESDRPYSRVPSRLQQESQGETKHTLRGILTDKDLTAVDSMLVIARSPEARDCWTPDLKDPKQHILQKMVVDRLPAKKRVTLVVDGSGSMAEHFDAIAEALVGLSGETQVDLLVASDEIVSIPLANASGNSVESLVKKGLRDAAGHGGCDNVPALLRAFEQAGAGENVVVWVHAAQPVILQPATPLVQWLERDSRTNIYDFAVESGPNRLIEQFGVIARIHSVPRFGRVREDLHDQLMRLTGQADDCRLDRNRTEDARPETPEASSHVARLWAAGRIAALAQTGKAADRQEAVELASNYQLVTSVSGAVVLETQQQYDDAKLKPADPDSTPDTPEPATWIMLLTTVPWLLWLAWRRRHGACGCS